MKQEKEAMVSAAIDVDDGEKGEWKGKMSEGVGEDVEMELGEEMLTSVVKGKEKEHEVERSGGWKTDKEEVRVGGMGMGMRAKKVEGEDEQKRRRAVVERDRARVKTLEEELNAKEVELVSLREEVERLKKVTKKYEEERSKDGGKGKGKEREVEGTEKDSAAWGGLREVARMGRVSFTCVM